MYSPSASMAQSQAFHSPAPGRQNVGRLVQQLNSTQKSPATAAKSPQQQQRAPVPAVPAALAPHTKGRSSPLQMPTSPNPLADTGRHAVCQSPAAALSTSPRQQSASPPPPGHARQPAAEVSAKVSRHPPPTRPLKPKPMPKPRDKPKVHLNSSNQVVLPVKSRSRSGRRFSPRNSPQSTLESSATNIKAQELLEAVAGKKPLPKPKPRVESNPGGLASSPENELSSAGTEVDHGEDRPPAVDVATAAAGLLLTTSEGVTIKKRPVRRRTSAKPQRPVQPQPPPPPAPYAGQLMAQKKKENWPPPPPPCGYELAGPGFPELRKTLSESSVSSSGGHSDENVNAGVQAGLTCADTVLGEVCYEAVDHDTLLWHTSQSQDADESAWEDVDGTSLQQMSVTPSNVSRLKNIAGRLWKGGDGQASVSAKKASDAIAAVSAFFRHRPGKVSPQKTTSAVSGDDADVYSDVSESEWGDQEDEAVYSCIEERELPYSSHMIPQPGAVAAAAAASPAAAVSPSMHSKPLPPVPYDEEQYSYATAGGGDACEPPPRVAREKADAVRGGNGPLFYSVSENAALETEVTLAGLPADPNDDSYFAVGQSTLPSGVKAKPDGLLHKAAIHQQRSPSPLSDPKPATAAASKSKPVRTGRPPCRPPPPVTSTLLARKAGQQPLPPPPPTTELPTPADPTGEYSEVNWARKTSVSKPYRPQSVGSWDTPPPPLIERIRTSSLKKNMTSVRPAPSPDHADDNADDNADDKYADDNADTLTNEENGRWDRGSGVDTFTPGYPPPRMASMSASEKSGEAEFQTLLERHRVKHGTAHGANDECSDEDEDELTNNAALGTICSNTAFTGGDSRTNTLDRVVFTCSVDSNQPVNVRTRSVIIEGVAPGEENRMSYTNVTTLHQDDGTDGDGTSPFYQNTDEVMATAEPDQGDLFLYGELPYRGEDGSVAIRPVQTQGRKPSMDYVPLPCVRNKISRMPSPDRLSSSFGLEEPALYQYVSDLNFKSSPLVPLHFGSGNGPFGGDPDSDGELEDNNAIYQGLDSATYQTIGKESPDQRLQDSVRETKRRMLWSEQDKVQSSGILSTIKEEERRLQEAHFEVISSEMSYNRSLKILIDHFMEAPAMSPDLPPDQRALNRESYKLLFSNVRDIYEMSCKLLDDLKTKESQAICFETVCDTIYEFVKMPEFFEPYVTYCKNQIYQLRGIKQLQEKSPRFNEVVSSLERDKLCQGLPLLSFFTLPTQRITRLPLLLVAIIDRMKPEDKHYEMSQQALELSQALVRRCNEAARSMERTEQLIELQKKIDFGKLRQLPLVSPSRWLVRSSELNLLSVEKGVIRKGARVHKQAIHVFLFNDLLIMAKKKAPGGLGLTNDSGAPAAYSVLDFAWRSAVELEDLQDQAPAGQAAAPSSAANGSQYAAVQPAISSQLSRQGSYDVATVMSAAGAQNAMKLVLLENAHHRNAVFLLVAENQTEKFRWVDAVNPPQATTAGETIYGEWDCPQVKVTYPYASCQPDELTLSGGEVIKVLRKMPDGWYEGERLRDGLVGWFPSTHVKEIQNEHTRLRNIRHHYHMLNANKRDILTPIKAEKPSRSPRKLTSRLVRLNSSDKM